VSARFAEKRAEMGHMGVSDICQARADVGQLARGKLLEWRRPPGKAAFSNVRRFRDMLGSSGHTKAYKS
jgi:hypothetical protein